MTRTALHSPERTGCRSCAPCPRRPSETSARREQAMQVYPSQCLTKSRMGDECIIMRRCLLNAKTCNDEKG
eukprot:scaffold3014_cov215-Prasinococcus_capsulatus_cf.AAC.1